MAMESSHIKAEVTEIGEFPQLAQRFGVRAVPTTVIDGQLVVMGAMDESKLLEQVLKAAVSDGTLSPASEQGGPTSPAGPPPQPSAGSGERSPPPGGGIVLP